MLKRSAFPALILLLAALLLAACSLPGGQTAQGAASVAINAPQDGANYSVGDLVDVQARVSAPQGAASVTLAVNQADVRTEQFQTPMQAGRVFIPWRPEQPGEYDLVVRVEDASGGQVASAPVRVTVGAALVVEETFTETPLPGATSSPTSDAPQAAANVDANCRLGPDTAYDSVGALGSGQSVPIVGRNPQSSWWLVQLPGGVECWVADSTVDVVGNTGGVAVVQPPPTPTPTVPPLAAPQPLSPSGALACTSSVMLQWSPVSHPNGIDHYEWELLDGGADSGSTVDTEVEAFISCSTGYQWRVRAVDSQGNIGPWSDYLSFSIN